MKSREEVNQQYTWNTKDIYPTKEAYQNELIKIQESANTFTANFKRQLTNSEISVTALKEYEEILTMESWLDHYAFLLESENIANTENQKVVHETNRILSHVHSQLTFLDSELMNLSEDKLDAISVIEPKFQSYIRHLKKQKQLKLPEEVTNSIELLKPILEAPERLYQQLKLNDLKYESFKVNDADYSLTFSNYEDIYAQHPDTEVRRSAFKYFSYGLRQYQNTAAEIYYTHVKTEKTLATMHGFDSVIDYLLYEQEVDRSYYNQQLDTLMTELSPVMRKYIEYIKEVHKLDKMTFADIKLELKTQDISRITIEKSEEIISKAINPLGDYYKDTVMKVYSERWVDFVENEGKETGGFYSCPYGNHPFILLTWKNRLANVFTLIHELGHAGQGLFSTKNNSILGCYPSLYLSESASTFNELLLVDSLVNESKDIKVKQFALKNMISKTYFHNFVTHMLEAVYQREVYRLIDTGKSFDAKILNTIKKGVLHDFWGDSVELVEGAELTWMRQNHYYGGLYPYTYSAGLTIATQAFLNMKKDSKAGTTNWLNFLKLGDQLPPVEAAKIAGVDISTVEPLRDTIQFIRDTIDQMIELN